MHVKAHNGENLSNSIGAIYAQTNVQLFNQLQREGCSEADLELIRDAYELATRLYAGYFTGSGRTQIAHVVGAASILASAQAPMEVIAASLIHNVYVNGDFGVRCQGATASKRKEVHRVVGPNVEQYVYRFYELRLTAELPFAILGGSVKADKLTRQTILIDLAERLDHWLNYEGRGFMKRNGQLMIRFARESGLPTLAAIITAELEKPMRDARLEELVKKARGHQSGSLAPRSYRRRVWAWAIFGLGSMNARFRIGKKVRRMTRTLYEAGSKL